MARSFVFTIVQHYADFVRRINKYGGVAASYLTPAQVVDLNSAADGFDLHWGAGSPTYVPFRQQP